MKEIINTQKKFNTNGYNRYEPEVTSQQFRARMRHLEERERKRVMEQRNKNRI